MSINAVAYQQGVGDEKAEKDGQQQLDGFFHAAQVEHDEQDQHRDFGAEFDRLHTQWQQAEQGIRTARYRDSDGQHIINHQCCTRHQPGMGAKQTCGYLVTATS